MQVVPVPIEGRHMPVSLLRLLDEVGPSPLKRGRAFERLCRWYLQNDPTYRVLLKKVWLWDEWPGRWRAGAWRLLRQTGGGRRLRGAWPRPAFEIQSPDKLNSPNADTLAVV